MTTEAIREKLISYLSHAEDKALIEIYRLLENAVNAEKSYDLEEDINFVAEMNKRYADYKSGKVELMSLEDTERKAKEALDKKNGKDTYGI